MCKFNLKNRLKEIYSKFPEAEKAPVIGITTNHEGMDATLREKYYEQVVKAGGVPMLIPPVNDVNVIINTLNAIDGLPVDDVAATWVAVTPPSSAITTKTSTHGSNASTTANRDTDDSSNTVAAHVPVTLADGLATALFTTPATQLRAHFPFECAILNANRTAAQSPNFPGGFFTH